MRCSPDAALRRTSQTTSERGSGVVPLPAAITIRGELCTAVGVASSSVVTADGNTPCGEYRQANSARPHGRERGCLFLADSLSLPKRVQGKIFTVQHEP